MAAPIHWHEGLFLQPHHLQRLQKCLFDSLGEERKLTWSYPYGVIEARLSHDELENMRIRFDKLRVVMPSGLEVNFPDNAELPSLDIKQAFAASGGTVYVLLGVPLWFDRRANAIAPGQVADSRVKVLFRTVETEVADENTGENPKPVLVRRINARLLLDKEDPSDLEVIPLLRIVRGVGDQVGLPRQDPEYVAPCLVMTGSPVLRELVRDLASQVAASRKELVVQLTRAGFSLENLRGLQFEQLMRLHTLNKFSARLPSLAEAPGIAPFFLYLELRELLGELTAMHPDRDEFEVAPYDHDNPYLPFSELSSKIRSFLRGAVAPSFLKLPFVNLEGWLTAIFQPQHLSGPNEYFLGIKTGQDPRALARLVEDADKFKLMPRSLATRAIRGVLLKEERFAPLELPAQTGLYYFRLLRNESARSWQQIQTEKAAVAVWPDQATSDYDVSLYMTVPPGTAE
jgi:type VI secretion system ImpJ/VasE family protein